MPHRLVLVRHARAAPSAGPDLLRPLTDDGTQQARRQGERLAELAAASGFGELGPILCSPAARCIQTASGILEGLGRDGFPDVRSDLAEASPARLMVGLALASEPGSILVGHQPSLADLACSLLGSTSLPVALAPSTALLLKRPDSGSAWSLAGVLPPP